jgi:hypothetical protein
MKPGVRRCVWGECPPQTELLDNCYAAALLTIGLARKTVLKFKFRDDSHINVKEVRALVASVGRYGETLGGHCCNVVGIDSRVAMGAAAKGRSSSGGLYFHLRRLAGLCLKLSIRLFMFGCPLGLTPVMPLQEMLLLRNGARSSPEVCLLPVMLLPLLLSPALTVLLVFSRVLGCCCPMMLLLTVGRPLLTLLSPVMFVVHHSPPQSQTLLSDRVQRRSL